MKVRFLLFKQPVKVFYCVSSGELLVKSGHWEAELDSLETSTIIGTLSDLGLVDRLEKIKGIIGMGGK